MRWVLVAALLAALVYSATILTRADSASIQAAMPVLQTYFPDVKFIPADPTQWRALIDRGGVDFLWAGAPVLYESLYREGYLAPMPEVPELSLVPDTFGGVPLKRYGPDGKIYYVVYGFLGYVIGYNPEAVRKSGVRPICSWKDFASVELAKFYAETGARPVALARPTKSTSAAAMMQLVTEIYGWEEGWKYLTAMAAVARFVDSSGAARDLVTRGEALLGPMVDYFVFIAGLDYCIPADGTDLLLDPIAVPRGANTTVAAALLRVFLREVVKKTVDRYILPSNLEVLDSPDVNRTKAELLKRHLQRLENSKIFHVPPEKSASYYYSFIYYYEATLVDPQDLLTEVWVELVSAYLGGKISKDRFEQLWAQLAAPVSFVDPATGERKVFTYQVAVELNSKIAGDAAYRDVLYSTWREAAVAKYQKIREELRRSESPGGSTQYILLAAAAATAAFTIFILLYRVKRYR